MTQHWTFGWDEIAAFSNAGAVVVAALVGVWGVKRWQTERGETRQAELETRQAELGEEALALMYRATEVFDHIRSPMAYAGEGGTRPKQEDETSEEARERDSDFVPFERINNYQEFFQRVIDIRPRVKAVFGKNKADPLNKVLENRGKVEVAARMINRLKGRDYFRSEQQHREHFEHMEKYEAVIWKGLGEPDQIDADLREAVAEMESTVEPILRSQLRTAEENDCDG